MAFIKNIENNNIINLTKCSIDSFPIDKNRKIFKIDKTSKIIRICFLDTETTGIDTKKDEIIEIALKVIEFNKTTGEYIKAISMYESFNEPDKEITNEVTQITCITFDMVKGKKINWDKVGEILSYSQIVLAHNAKFDRQMIEKYFNTFSSSHS